MMLLITACDGTSSETVVVRFFCLKINEYDDKTQERALAELEKLPKDSALRLFIGDYKHLRDQARKCREKANPA